MSPLEKLAYEVLPDRYGDCATTRNHKKRWRRDAIAKAESGEVKSSIIFDELRKKDFLYE